MKALRRFTVRAHLPTPRRAGPAGTNLRWSWDKPTQDLFASIDPALWANCGHDPVALLGAVNPARLDELALDEGFLGRLDELAGELDDYLSRPLWYQQQQQDAGHAMPTGIAYFSMEFGVAEVLPNYSGGLGILAGDHLKSASDLGVPLIAVGLYYRSGYFRQSLTADGWQHETYPSLDPQGLPLRLLTDASGAPVLVELSAARLRAAAGPGLGGAGGPRPAAAAGFRRPRKRTRAARHHRPPVRRRPGASHPAGDSGRRRRGAGDPCVHRHRRAARARGVPHERGARRVPRSRAHPRADHRRGTGLRHRVDGGAVQHRVHHPHPGARRYRPVPRRHGASATSTTISTASRRHGRRKASALLPGVPTARIIALGAEDDPTKFNMAHMGLRLAQRANGVSLLHGRVSRAMFSGLWRGFDRDEVPIGSITNGVHARTWAAPQWLQLGRELAGSDSSFSDPGVWLRLQQVDPGHLWWIRSQLRALLVEDVRRRLRQSWLERGASDAELGWIATAFDPNVLTIGFARRVPTYKRLTLMLRDPGSAGTAAARRATADSADRRREIPPGRRRRQGADPAGGAVRRPAAGASPHRVPAQLRHVDGPGSVLGLRRLAEQPAAAPGGVRHLRNEERAQRRLEPVHPRRLVGRVVRRRKRLGDTVRHGVTDEVRRDDLEASALYNLLEHAVAPKFYERDDRGVPPRWIEMVRHTLQTLGPKVLASRMVRDYVEQYYVPAAQSLRKTVAAPDGDG